MKKILFCLAIVMLVLSACSSAADVPASTTPLNKPAPTEAFTQYVGVPFSDLGWDIFLAVSLSIITAVGIFIILRNFLKGAAPVAYTVFGFVGVLALVMFLQSIAGIWVTVPADKVGLVLRYGEVTGDVLQPGLHTLTPWRDEVALISIREFVYITTSHVEDASEDFPDYPVGARTCDGVNVEIPYTIRFRVNTSPESLPDFFRYYGSIVAAEERVVKVVSRQVVRDIPTGYSAVSLYASEIVTENSDMIADLGLRDMLSSNPCGQVTTGFEALNEQIAAVLSEEFSEAGLELTFFGIRQPDLGAYGEKLDSARQAAMDVQIAYQGFLKAQQDQQTTITNATAAAEAQRVQTITAAEADASALIIAANAEAEQMRISATAEKDATITLAEGEAQAVLLAASAQAEANQQIAASLTPDLLTYSMWQWWTSAWNGQQPQIVFGDGTALPVIQLPPLQEPIP